MGRKHIEIKVDGQISPEMLNVDELGEMFSKIQTAVFEIAKMEGVELDGPYFSLVEIEQGSLLTLVALSPVAVGFVNTLGESISSRDYRKIPRKAQKSLYSLSRKLVKHTWSLKVREVDDLGVGEWEISESNPVPEPEEPGQMSGQTVTYGKLVWLNGEKKTAGFDLQDVDASRLSVKLANEEMVQRLDGGMYQTWRIEGKATWQVSDWNIIDFQVADVSLMKGDPSELFEKLAVESGGEWDDVDAGEFVNKLRSGGEV